MAVPWWAVRPVVTPVAPSDDEPTVLIDRRVVVARDRLRFFYRGLHYCEVCWRPRLTRDVSDGYRNVRCCSTCVVHARRAEVVV